MDKDEEFVQGLYDEANEQLKEVYKEQKQNRDVLLQEIAKILLTYIIVNDIMSMDKTEKDKEYSRLSKLITAFATGQAKTTEKVITDILTNTVNNTFDYYSYNAKLKDVEKIIGSNFKGKHFSERVWDNEQEVAKHLHSQVKGFLKGDINVNQIKKNIETTFNTNAYNAKRLTETEVSRCSNGAFDRFCIETNVKTLRYKAILCRTCDECMSHHDKIFDFKNKIEIPKHPICHCYYEIVE